MDVFQDLMAAYNISDISSKESENNNIANFNLKPPDREQSLTRTDSPDGDALIKNNGTTPGAVLNVPSVYGQGDQTRKPTQMIPSNSLEKLERLVGSEPAKPKRKRSKATKSNDNQNAMPGAILKVPQYMGRQNNNNRPNSRPHQNSPYGTVSPPEMHPIQPYPQNNGGHMNIPCNPFAPRPPHFPNQFLPPFDRPPMHMHNDRYQQFHGPMPRGRGPMHQMMHPPHQIPNFPQGMINHSSMNVFPQGPPGNGMFGHPNPNMLPVNGNMQRYPGPPMAPMFEDGLHGTPGRRMSSEGRMSSSSTPTPDVVYMNKPNSNVTVGSPQLPVSNPTPPRAGSVPTTSPKPTQNQSTANQKPENVKTSQKKQNIDTSYLQTGITEVTLLARENPLPRYTPIVSEEDKNRMPSETFVCNSCGDTFLFKSSLDEHMNRKSLEISYSCSVCAQQYTFFNKCAHIAHVEKHNEEATVAKYDNLKVGMLQLAPKEKLLLESQKEKCVDSRVDIVTTEIICPECPEKFKTAKELAAHFQGTGKLDINDVCSMCQLPLPSKCSLKAHNRIHQKIMPQVCPECGLNIISREGFTDHIKVKCLHLSRTVRYSCDVCEEQFEEQTAANKHMRSKHADGYWKCHRCPMAFKSRESFYGHFSQTHGTLSPEEGNTWIVKCPMCNTVFRKANVLYGHIQKHYAEEMKYRKFRFQCFHCATLVKTKQEMHEHLKVSHQCTYTRCDKCNVNCSTLTELENHSETCSGIVGLISKSASPDNAKKSVNNAPVDCATAESLKSLYAPYECPICSNKYFYRDSLYKHRKVHEKNGQFICLLCSSIFADKISQKNHSRTCWKEKANKQLKNFDVHLCTSCNDTFVSKDDLDKHIREAHPSPSKNQSIRKKNSPEKASQEIEKIRVENELKEMFNESIEEEDDPAPDSTPPANTNTEEHTCSTCSMVFKTKEDMITHAEKSHTSSLFKYVCYICRDCQVYKAFHRRDYLEKHIVNFHKIQRAKIDYTRFPDEPEKEKNVAVPTKINAEKKRPASPFGNGLPAKKQKVASFYMAEDEDSSGVESEVELYKCGSCSFTCENKGDFEDHVSEHKAEEESIECPECGMGFVVERTLRNHLFIVHKVRDYEKYSRRQRAKKQFDDHIAIVSQPVVTENGFESDSSYELHHELECRRCKKEFDTENGLKKHIERAHPNWNGSPTKRTK